MLSPHLGAKNEGRMVMFYVKEKTDEIEVKVELNSENVFCSARTAARRSPLICRACSPMVWAICTVRQFYATSALGRDCT